MAVKIKICGLKRSEDIQYVNEYRPDYVGFVFFPPSLRYVTVEKAQQLRKSLSPNIIPVGVFLDDTLEKILEVAESKTVQILQIHGKTAPKIVKELKRITTIPVWEAISVNSEADIQKAKKSLADMILLDHGQGGTGKIFNWKLLRNIGRAFFLAGGLNAFNIKEALKCNPYGVDTSSGVEKNNIKDREMIREFIKIVRAGKETNGNV